MSPPPAGGKYEAAVGEAHKILSLNFLTYQTFAVSIFNSLFIRGIDTPTSPEFLVFIYVLHWLTTCVTRPAYGGFAKV